MDTENKPVREMWDAKQAAEYLQVDDSTVRLYAKQKKIPGRQIGSQWRFYRDELENLPVQ